MTLSEEALDPPEVIKTWFERCRSTQHAHYALVTRFVRANSIFTWSATILSAIVGSTVFAVLSKDVRPWTRAVVGSLSVAAAVITALKSSLQFGERAEMHRVAAAKFGDLRREFELLFAQAKTLPGDELVKRLDAIRERMRLLTLDAPPIPTGLFRKTREGMDPTLRA